MKKVIYIVALIATLAFSFSSCTEDVVKPKDNAGGTSTSNEKGS